MLLTALTLTLSLSVHAQARDPSDACVESLTIENFRINSADLPPNNRDALFTVGNDQAMLHVTRAGVDVVTVVDNRAAGLDLSARPEVLLRVAAGDEIVGSRLNERRDEMYLHVVSRATVPWRRDQNVVIGIETRPGRVFVGSRRVAPAGARPTRDVLPGISGPGLTPLLTKSQRGIIAALDRDANVHRFGGFAIGNQSRLLGQLSTADAWFGLYARPHEFEGDEPVATLADLGTLLENQRVRLSLVRIDDRAAVAHFEGRGHPSLDFASFDGPYAAHLLARVATPRAGSIRDATPDARLVRVELSNPRWEPLALPAQSSARAERTPE